jgi:hypothetical protein
MWKALLLVVIALALGIPSPVSAQVTATNRLCDPAFENCRATLLELIRNETVGIDVGFWFMEDSRYSTELVKRRQAGVPVRVVLDARAFTSYGYTTAKAPVDAMRLGGIPMRHKTGSALFHFKMMLFAGQNVVEFSGANYSDEAFVPRIPYENYVDEVIHYSSEPSIVNSFKTMFDTVWTDTSQFANYANVSGSLVRHYPTFAIDPEMQFSPWTNFATRSIARYRTETLGIDSIMYRITDRRHTDQMIAAENRGVAVRLISEPQQYRSPTKYWHAWNIDRMYMAGVQIRHRLHAGQNHEKLTILHRDGSTGLPMTILGSSNWTSASAASQQEHNRFTSESWIYNWARSHFNRKWNNTGPAPETQPFVPLPPNTPSNRSPANGALDQPTTVTLKWHAGFWAHKYDVYIGTSTSNMTKVLSDRELGPSSSSSNLKSWTISGLAPGTTYYWKITSRTMANLARTGATWSFRTSGTGTPTEPPPPTSCGSLPSGWTGADIGAVGATGTSCYSGGTFTIEGSGADIWGSTDEFRFVYRTLTGDGYIIARVASLENVDAWTKSGVMMRASLAANAAHASFFVSPGKGLAFQRRVTAGGTTTHTSGGSGSPPQWVGLLRKGNTFGAYRSTNGSSWTLVASQTISMGSTIYVGIPVTSHRDGTLATATVTGVSVD